MAGSTVTTGRDGLRRCGRALIALSLLAACSVEGAECPLPINKEKSLLIRHLSVVENEERTRWTGGTGDPADGAWSFGRLLASMAGDRQPSEFARRWLDTLMRDRLVNGDPVPARAWIRDRIVVPWELASGGSDLDLTKAPFRLLAIAFRADERNLAAGLAGVLRFVYAAHAPDLEDQRGGVPLPFTVAVDFALPAATEQHIMAWAESFRSLSDRRFGLRFNAALTRLTSVVTSRNARPDRPNGSALLQLRTNDAVDVAAPWVLQEFRINPVSGWLSSVPVVKTPSARVNDTSLFASWIRVNRDRLLASGPFGSIPVPLSFRGTRFQAGAITNVLGNFWNAPQVPLSLQFRVALNTCDGCHGTETDTPFTHVFPRGRGEVAFISAYLSGNWSGSPSRQLHLVADPRDIRRTRGFNELARRARDLSALLCSTAPAGVN